MCRKETFDASLVAFEDANEMAHRKFANSRKGICSCLHWVEKRHGIRLDDVIFCAEDMGSYISEMAVCASDRTLTLEFFTDLAVGNQVFDGYCPWQNRQDDAGVCTICDHSLSEDSLLSACKKKLCQLRTWLILRAHLAKQRVAKLVLLEKLDYKEKFTDVSAQHFHPSRRRSRMQKLI